MKFLIIRFSSIGDIVLTTPVIRCLAKKYPEASLYYLTKKKFEGIVSSNPYVSKVLVLNEDLLETIEILKEEKFDAVIDLHHNLRTLRIKQALKGVPFYSFNKLNTQKWIYTTFKINLLPPLHIVDRYLQAARPLGVENDGEGLDYFIPEPEEVPQEDLPLSHVHGYIAVVIGAAHETKKLPLPKLMELCAQIPYPIMLLGGKEDFDHGQQIASQDPVKIYNTCGKFTLNESADIIRKSKLVISHDTGLMHIAAAFHKTIFSIWGNTVPSFGMYPYKTSHKIFQVNHLWCRPCSKIGYDKCPMGHFKCMMKIPVLEIASRVSEDLKILGT
ncbi:MAG: glycosyltransferase family 9 protein [Bacteroidota bacterium]|nr:glycosyltransferase family 9 protein [Bacteroidota bacterium]